MTPSGGHRRDPIGYGKELERFDEKLGELLPLLGEDDLLMITADHGNDPTYTGTDHTREKVPFLSYSPSMKGQGELPEAETFAVIGGTILDNFGLKKEGKYDRGFRSGKTGLVFFPGCFRRGRPGQK